MVGFEVRRGFKPGSGSMKIFNFWSRTSIKCPNQVPINLTAGNQEGRSPFFADRESFQLLA